MPRLVINGRFVVQEVTGVQRVAHEIVREIDRLLARGELAADVTLLCPPGRRVQRLDYRHVKVRTVGRMSGMWWEQCELPRHTAGAALLCLANSAPVFSLAGRAPVSVMIHDVSYLNHPDAYRLPYRLGHRLMLPLLLRGATCLFTVSETERERIEGLYPKSATPIVVVPNGGWSSDDLPAAGKAPALPSRFVLYVGSLSRRKNFDRTLATAIRLAREDDIDTVIVGSAGRVLRPPELDVPADVAGRIHFLGQVNDRAVLGRVYAAAQVLLFPSLYEASPLPPVEAAHFGCPVVASNIPSIWERCGDSVTYCDPRSLDSIIGAVRLVLASPETRRRPGADPAEAAGGRTWEAQARSICAAILPAGSLTSAQVA